MYYDYYGGPRFAWSWEDAYEEACEKHPYEANNEPEPPIVDMRTFTGIIIYNQFISGAAIKQNDDYVKIRCVSDLLKIDKINEEGGSHCQKCNEFNEYVADPYYVCYSCKNG
jgi:hypothetical protein